VFAERRGVDALERILLSPEPGASFFTMNATSLSKLLTVHHIESPEGLSVDDILGHLLSGSCLSMCDPNAANQYACHCSQYNTVYPSSQAMTFCVISVIISASTDRLPDDRVRFIASCLGLH
jgi:hypothetical protein